ncbi:MAG: DUF2339 domain-containing protein [Planctomycetota bacterium]|jgi:uncharacterized membrane protein
MEVLIALLILAIPVLAVAGFVLAVKARKRIAHLEMRFQSRVRTLERRVAELEPGPSSPATPAPTPTPPRPVVPKADPDPEIEVKPTPKPTPVAAAAQISLEERIGGRWFNWVGILAMLFGVAYALKYSFDQGWVSPRMRFFSGLGLGALLLGAGVLSERKRYEVLARGFWGGAVGVLFLVFFAGFRLLADDGVPIIGRGTAFAGMAFTTVLGVVLATVYDTRTVALFAAVGGYLTPLLLGSKEPDQVFLFSYLAVLTAGLLALGYAKRWAFLRALTFSVIVVYFSGWFVLQGVGRPGVTLLFTSLMFLCFSAEIAAWSAFLRVVDRGWSYFLLGLATTLHGLVAVVVAGEHFPAYRGVFLAATAAYLLAIGLLVRRRHRRDIVLFRTFANAAALAFVLAPVFEQRIDGAWLGVAWVFQGAALLWAGERWRALGWSRWWGIGTLGLAALRLLAFDTPELFVTVDPYRPFWSARAAAYAIFTGAFGFACWRVWRRERDTQRPGEELAHTAVWIVGLALPVVWCSLELSQAFDVYVAPRFADRPSAYTNTASYWMTLLWAAYATLVATVANRRAGIVLRNVALAFGCAVLVKYVARDLVATYVEQSTPLFNSRFAVTAALAAALFWIAREIRVLAPCTKVVGHVLLLAAACMEWVDFFQVRSLDTGRLAGVSLAGITVLMAAYGTGLALRGGTVLRAAGPALVGLAGAKWLLIDLTLSPTAGDTLLQPRTAAAAVAAGAAFYVASRAGRAAIATGLRVVAHLVVACALSAELRDLITGRDWSALGVVRFGDFAIAGLWAVYGLLALARGHAQQRSHLRGLGLAFVVGSVAGVALLLGAGPATHLVANTRLLGLGAVAVALLWSAELYRRRDLQLDAPLELGGRAEGPALAPPLVLASHLLLMLLFTLEASDYFRNVGSEGWGAGWIDAKSARQLSYSLIWAAYAIGLVVGGLLRKFRPVRLMALSVLSITIFKVFLVDLSFLNNPYRMLSFLALGAILVAVSFLYQKYKAYLV